MRTKIIFSNDILNEDGKLDADKIRMTLRDTWHIKIGRNRAYYLIKLLKKHHPDKFSIESAI